jgi:hypothetical protein
MVRTLRRKNLFRKAQAILRIQDRSKRTMKNSWCHTLYISLSLNRTGQMQNRIVIFKDSFLHLENEKPFTSNSRLVTHKLT